MIVGTAIDACDFAFDNRTLDIQASWWAIIDFWNRNGSNNVLKW